MTGDHVPSQFVTNLQCALEIEPRSVVPTAGGGHSQRFGGGVDRKPAATVLLSCRNHGETHAIAGDRRAVDDRAAIIATRNLQSMQTYGPRLDRKHLANVGHDPCKHVTPARMSRRCPRRSSP